MEMAKRKATFLISHIPPIPALEEYVDYIWHIKDEVGTYAQHPNRLVPQGNFELILDLKHSSFFKSEGRWERHPKAFLAGLLDRRYFVKTEGPSELLGLVFKPGRFQHFSTTSIQALKGEICCVGEPSVFEEPINGLYEKIRETTNDQKKYLLLQNYLLKMLNEDTQLENAFVFWAIEKMKRQNGNISISELAKDIRVSERHLRRRFKEVVGFSPKFFTKLIRLGHVLETIEIAKRKNHFLNEMPSIASYFDQSHFIRDFQAIVGILPKGYIREDNPLAGVYLNLNDTNL